MKRIRLILIAVVLVLAVMAVVQMPMNKSQPSGDSDNSGVQIGGDFELVNQNGEPVKSSDLNDKYKLVFFGFTNCPAICPTSMAVITAALADVDDADDIYPIFISVDPDRDSPEQIKTFLENFDERFIGLTGSKEETEDVKQKFRVFAAKAKIELDGMYDMQHSSIIYVFDKDWKYIKHFNHQDSSDRIAAVLNDML